MSSDHHRTLELVPQFLRQENAKAVFSLEEAIPGTDRGLVLGRARNACRLSRKAAPSRKVTQMVSRAGNAVGTRPDPRGVGAYFAVNAEKKKELQKQSFVGKRGCQGSGRC